MDSFKKYTDYVSTYVSTFVDYLSCLPLETFFLALTVTGLKLISIYHTQTQTYMCILIRVYVCIYRKVHIFHTEYFKKICLAFVSERNI